MSSNVRKKRKTGSPPSASSSLQRAAKRDAGHPWFACALLAIVIGAVYGRALDVPFIFDDDISIIRNTSITSLWPPFGRAEHPGPLNPPADLPTSSRPLVNVSFALNYYFGGLNPFGYHAINLLIHIGSATLVFATTRRTLRLPFFGGRFATTFDWIALAVALLWALHPLQTETVIYATQRTELMMAFFYLATLYCSLRYWDALPQAAAPPSEPGHRHRREAVVGPRPTQQSKVWLILAVLACLCGMASKEVMVSAPLIVLLFDRTFVAGSIAKAWRRSWPLYAGLASSWILLVVLVLTSPRSASAGFGLGVTAYSWWLTQTKILLMYLKLVVWPSPLLIHYQLPYLSTLAEAWPYAIAVLLLGLTTLWLLWRNRPLGFLGTCMFAILAPTFVVPIITEMAAERRMYLPLLAIAALFVLGIWLLVRARFGGWQRGRQTVSAEIPPASFALPMFLLALTYAVLSVSRLGAYQNALGLWQEVLRYQPENYTAHQNMGYHLDKAGDTSAAIEHFIEAIILNPEWSRSHYSLAVLLTKTGAHEKAAFHFAEAARLMPSDVPAQINLAAALIAAGRYDEAVEASRSTLKLNPDMWIVHNNLGVALQKAGKYRQAIDSLQQALRLNPEAIDIYNDIADTYILANQPAEAIAQLEQGLGAALGRR